MQRKDLQLVEKIVHVRNYKVGEPVFQQGEVGVGMYIIVKGAVDIFIENMASREEMSQAVFVTRLQHGDFFGELALVEGSGRRTASAVAGEETILVGFFKPDLEEILSRNPGAGALICLHLAEILGRRLKETTDKVSKLKRELQG